MKETSWIRILRSRSRGDEGETRPRQAESMQSGSGGGPLSSPSGCREQEAQHRWTGTFLLLEPISAIFPWTSWTRLPRGAAGRSLGPKTPFNFLLCPARETQEPGPLKMVLPGCPLPLSSHAQMGQRDIELP